MAELRLKDEKLDEKTKKKLARQKFQELVDLENYRKTEGEYREEAKELVRDMYETVRLRTDHFADKKYSESVSGENIEDALYELNKSEFYNAFKSPDKVLTRLLYDQNMEQIKIPAYLTHIAEGIYKETFSRENLFDMSKNKRTIIAHEYMRDFGDGCLFGNFCESDIDGKPAYFQIIELPSDCPDCNKFADDVSSLGAGQYLQRYRGDPVYTHYGNYVALIADMDMDSLEDHLRKNKS